MLSRMVSGSGASRRKPRFRGRVSAVGRVGPSRVDAFVQRDELSVALRHATGVAHHVYGGGARVLEPDLRRELLGSGSYLYVVVEVPAMPEDEFIRKYDAFMEGVWEGMATLDPALITFSVQSRARACA